LRFHLWDGLNRNVISSNEFYRLFGDIDESRLMP